MPRRINVELKPLNERKAQEKHDELLRKWYAKQQIARIQTMRDAEELAVIEDKRVEMLEKEKEEQAARLKFDQKVRRPLGEELKSVVAEKERQTELKIRIKQALQDQELMKKEMMAIKEKAKGGKKRKTKRKTKKKTKKKTKRKTKKKTKRKKRRTKRRR